METMPQAWFVNLGLKIYNLPRVAVNIFGFEIYWYAIIICMGIVAGLTYAVLEAKRTGQDPDIYLDFFFVAFIMALAGARLYYVIFNFGLYKDNLIDILNIRAGGLAVYGGVIGGVIAAVIYTRRKNLNFWLLADTAAPAFILGQFIGRWANFVNREAFGGYTDSLFALRYLASEVNNIPAQVYEHMVLVDGVNYIQVQPTFLYESFFCLIVFIILNILKRSKTFDGEVLLLYLTGYGTVRFFIESMRTDQLMLFGTSVPVSMLVSAILVIFTGSALIYKYTEKKRLGL
ncbi:MAG: prolipoprotein diacylglyceryl transferase [Clostridiales bacterium]|jgi:phosphatidylglycerol:prolipoprotein diacylglycerol transferase|nr:prolipoprotein diacylglyceryl transferase [Clostridiales bacterium]